MIEKLERFIAMPEWSRFYMDKEQAQLCVTALRARAALSGSPEGPHSIDRSVR